MRRLHERSILPVLISYTAPYPDMATDSDGWDWIKIALRSFHEHFEGQYVLVIDNDGDDERYQPKKDWLYSYPEARVIRNPITENPKFWKDHDPAWNHHHGSGIDLAVAYCRHHRYEYMLYFEPDCLILGRDWVEAMWRCMEAGAWMSGFNQSNQSPRIIHICPSMWKVNEPPCDVSFSRQPIAADRQHRDFARLTEFREDAIRSWGRWDTAQKNWWIADLEGKACRARPWPQDFIHVWGGSGHSRRRRVREHQYWPKFRKYLY